METVARKADLQAEIDDLDRIILQTLQADGRAPFTQIAKQAGVSETTIRSRYRQLVENGIIRTVGIVDPYALGFHAPAMIGVSTAPGQTSQVAQAIADLPEVSYLVGTLGSFDLLIEVFCRDLQHLTALIEQDIRTIPGVCSSQTMMISHIHKLTYRWSPALE